ncbi:MAG: ribosome small subunit-dependent GTPase A [Bacteroidales bacterium]|nr:ribosome small subunit-dependent GTPase A [Bacteroidales bacterium]NMD04183.1 ribosome small subunit-dependent GTPase A [Bacteroidales bacterium]OQB64584.1 MAG: putative ribosome biogenesis GTPase RsgA [Bacteroidetes bacterium ADurb.Bin145]HOU00961.1 ribosome small subunit-dependent GTPase A [Bacteroidales bacterium]HQK66648.1 ribosome small subunit-dependent GTPase A [Bacteroidales bacterium]
MEKGLVIKSTGSRYRILYGSREIVECTIKGKFRVKDLRTTNPVAVGDQVLFEFAKERTSGVITEVLERKNYILRKASNLSKEVQIIAANIDQVFLMFTIILPETQAEFIDRFLITAEAYNIPASLIINKTDLYKEPELERMKYLISLYSNIGYKCFPVSVNTRSGIEDLKNKMQDKITLLSGNSGVGKTSFINILDPSLNLKTEEISEYHRQGKHITTFPEMHHLPFGGYVIDSPGMRGFGVVDMNRNEIYHFFPEIFRISKGCKFYNCLHLDEPGCAVRTAVENDLINPSRYRSYIKILEDENRKYR